MSIIEEALKKAQVERVNTTVDIMAGLSKKHVAYKKLAIAAMSLLTLLAIAFIGIKLNLFNGFAAKGEDNYTYRYAPAPSDTASQAAPADTDNSLIKIPRLKLSGVFYDNNKPFAIINNAIVEEGQEISGAKLIKVLKDKALLTWQGQQIQLVMD